MVILIHLLQRQFTLLDADEVIYYYCYIFIYFFSLSFSIRNRYYSITTIDHITTFFSLHPIKIPADISPQKFEHQHISQQSPRPIDLYLVKTFLPSSNLLITEVLLVP